MTGQDHIALDEQARAILRGNDRGGYTVPTAGLYPYQWNWDSAFAAWGFAQFDIGRAWDEVETLFSGQWPSGMVPHILFHQPDPGYFPGPDVWGADLGPIPSSGITQPPVAATFIRDIWEKDRAAGAERLEPLLPKILAWHQWFMDWRCCSQGLIFVTHPWEAGRDNCPDWDAAMALIEPVGVGEYTRRDTSHVDPDMRPTKADYDRYIWLVQRGRRLGWNDEAMAENAPFRIGDPTMTFTFLRANRDLLAMCDAFGHDCSDLQSWIQILERATEVMRNPDTGVYNAVNATTHEYSGALSNASFLCWYAGIDDAQMGKALEQTFADCPYPVPSHDVNASDFDPKRYWRGPTWAIMNALIGRGLEDMGHDEHARHLRQATGDLIATHGFAEYFDPLTGEAAGGGTFTWTAAVWLAWASPSARAQHG